VTSEDGIRYGASGACLGGRIRIHHGEWQQQYRLEPPHCDPR